jgi:mannan endo-1,4-beta-mannosidase
VAALSAKPVIIAETACAEAEGGKAAWISAMFESLDRDYDRVVGVVWFNARKEHDWRIESSSESSEAFRRGAARWTQDEAAR